MNTVYKLTILIAILLVLGCKAHNDVAQERDTLVKGSALLTVSKKQFEASGMANGHLQKKQFRKTITVNGQINLPKKSKAIVSSILSGTVGSINLLEGQWIKKGQPLFTVTNPELIDLQEEYLVLQSKIEYLKEEQERKQKLVNENLSPNQEFLLAQSDYQINQAKYKTVGQKLKLYGVDLSSLTIEQLKSSMTIYSPISGYISSINALRGQYIEPSTEVIGIDNKSNIHIELNVLERDAALIHTGQEINFTVTGAASRTYTSAVHLISPLVNDKGMIAIHGDIDDAKGLLPGMYATADVILESYESNALPEDAIVQIEGKDHILILSSNASEGSSFKPYKIEKGAIDNGYIEVQNSDNLIVKTILVNGGYYLVN